MKNPNFKTETQEELYTDFILEYDLELTDDQLNTIDDVYKANRLSAIYSVIVYRAINIAFALAFLAMVVFFNEMLTKTIMIAMILIYGGFQMAACFYSALKYDGIVKGE